ncbi:hypothetical protein CRM73_00180 [Kocuria sp. CCUG 69068]|uniref:hypothetical protein n=1 Tax=Kocuria sp. CCUG 69068 TaxID=2043138 RepID=UPI001E2ADAB6|nr:hypothetical protein [Kocuria sp. CCUG 69068]
MMDAATVLALVDAHTAQSEAIQNRVESLALPTVEEFEQWYSREAITAMTASIVAAVEAGQRQSAALTDAYIARVLSEMLTEDVAPLGATIDPAQLRQGITHQGVYGRLADQYRYQTALRVAAPVVAAAVLTRAQTMIRTDLQLARTHQARRSLGGDAPAGRRFGRGGRIQGYRRVIRPELSKNGVCGICLAASDRIYSIGDLLPIHHGCVCDVLPIVNGNDPGRDLNDDELNRLYDDAGTTARAGLIKQRYEITEHGEIGPLLVNPKHRHRGPDDLPMALDTSTD